MAMTGQPVAMDRVQGLWDEVGTQSRVTAGRVPSLLMGHFLGILSPLASGNGGSEGAPGGAGGRGQGLVLKAQHLERRLCTPQGLGSGTHHAHCPFATQGYRNRQRERQLHHFVSPLGYLNLRIKL